MYRKYQLVYRYAGNSRGWHLCIRCDGHLHVDERLAILGVGDYIFEVVQGAQDFTDRITVLTNGRPHGMSPRVLEALRERGAELEEGRIEAHIGQGLNLLGFRMADGRELFFDGFFVDEGLKANDEFLRRFDVAHDDDGLLRCSDDHEVLDSSGEPIAGLWAAGRYCGRGAESDCQRVCERAGRGTGSLGQFAALGGAGGARGLSGLHTLLA